MARFFVLGAGVEGTAGGRALAEAGHVVTFVDPAPARVAELAAAGLDARSELVLAGEPESVVLLCSPTADARGGFDLSGLRAAVVETGRALTGADMRHIVVVRSSVPPGTTRHLVGPLLERISGRPEGLAFAVAAMPMFLRSAAPDHDARRPRLSLIGANSLPIAQRVRDLMVPGGSPVKLYDDPATVELAKCVHSALHATRISLWNEVWQLCGRLGLEQDDVADAVAAGPDLGPQYGTRGGAPFAGERLPRDTKGLLGVGAQLGLDLPLLSAVVDVNSEFERYLEEELAELVTRS
jgi:UDPglucose 6-dehydrogenase